MRQLFTVFALALTLTGCSADTGVEYTDTPIETTILDDGSGLLGAGPGPSPYVVSSVIDTGDHDLIIKTTITYYSGIGYNVVTAEFSSKGTVLGTITLSPQQPRASQVRLKRAMTIDIEEIFIRPQFMQDAGGLGLYGKYTDIHGGDPKFFAGYVCHWNADGPLI